MSTTHRALLLALAWAASAGAAPASHGGIVAAIDENRRIELHGNTRPEANAANDLGRVADTLPMEHLLLQLKRSAEREAALNQFIRELHDPGAPGFHQWLTPEQFAASYGAAPADVAIVTSWLQSKGFTVNGVPANGMLVDFSGTAEALRNAFHTEIHHLRVNGAAHIANINDPQIPEALAPAVAGIVSLHDFKPRSHRIAKARGLRQPAYTYSEGNAHGMVPGDLATIYNLAPLFAAGYSGRGQTLMVVEDTYLYSTADWAVFRKTFGLARAYPYGTLSQVSPSGAISCANPGFQGKSTDPGYGDDGEAILDVEWATAAAPNAAIVLAACTDTSAFGGLIALQNTLNGPAAQLPGVVSISYGESEVDNGASANLAYYNAYQQAAAEGVSIFVSSGDEDAASGDEGSVATHGIGVSGFASTPFNVAVGGTDFGYTADKVDALIYWSATNSNTFASAKSYIQEAPWNNSCAGSLVAGFLGTTPLALCNSSEVSSTKGSLHGLQNAVGGSGGPSGCATGSAITRGVVSGTCKGYAKPDWQAGLLGNPGDKVRDIPDVSLFASNGFWDAYYVTCWSNPDTSDAVGGGYTCAGAPSGWAGFGGTSVSSPIMAGIQALVNQKTGQRWGNPDTVYYAMAKTAYGLTGSAACKSTTVNKTANACVFYDVTEGDNVAVCKGSGRNSATLNNCYRPGGPGSFGLLSGSDSAFAPAYPAGTGWDFATGIGSVNAYNLVMGWPSGQ